MIATLPAAGADPASRAAEPGARAHSEPTFEWTFNPWRHDVRNASIGAIVAAAVVLVIARLGLPPLAVVAMALAFLGAVHSAFLPTRCRVDAAGVARRLGFGWERRPWSAVRRAVLGPRGLFVSPRTHPGALESFQGLWLPLPAGAAPALLGGLRAHLARHGLAP
jgi:hypothetical protein